MLITVIVPIYNMEAYLCTSLDRLLQQSFQDYEILLIDDGSKDSSGEICDRYAREHSRIRVVHKPNGGLSTARNAGIEHARGEYLTFCDPDDWVDADYLQQFVEGRTYAARDRHPATPGRQIGPAADSACHGRTGPSLHGSHRRPAAARHAGIHRQ